MTVAAIANRPARLTVPARLLAGTLTDFEADLDELLFVCETAETELRDAGRELATASLHPGTRDLLDSQIDASQRRYRAYGEQLAALKQRARQEPPSEELAARLGERRRALADLLRTEQALTAALVVAGDWQSPSFRHSTIAACGRGNGRIEAHWNDYKRDRHFDADAFERRYVAAMVDGKPAPRALLTGCGMAAFTTILAYLAMEAGLRGPVLAGAGLYHESKLLLQRAVPGRLHFVDEGDTASMLRALDELRPSAVFLDSLSNTRWMPVPELPAVIDRLRGRETRLVVDNTGLSVACQPFALADRSVRLIVFESLLKYAQLGLDRANAGVILAREGDAEPLCGYREHLGTNVTDVAARALPRPDRRVLERRLGRLQRNASLLAHRLRGLGELGVAVIYPGLASHPCAWAARRLGFRGGCLSIVLPGRDAKLRRERELVEVAVAEAGRRGVALVGGSSFGFDITRIYLTAARADQGEPFVRVAVGTEHRPELEQLAATLAESIRAVLR